MKHSKILSPTRSIALLVLAGAMTLPLQGCNEELVPADSAANAAAPQIDELDDNERALAITGGLLYDEWMVELTAVTGMSPLPAGTNLLMTYANEGTAAITDAASWRCARCHGWDYKGADGNFGPSSPNRYTGIKGIMDASELSIEDLVEFLTNGKSYPAGAFANGPPAGAPVTLHNFSPYMTAEAIESLAYFVKYGTLNTNDYIGKFTGATYGDGENGAALFADTARCSECHGADGTDGIPGETVGAIANENPWEILHKIRFGQPGTAMPSSYDSGLSTQGAVDVMTHAQFLP